MGIVLFLLAAALIVIFIIVLSIVSLWKVFTKAGQPGWAVFVPFYNGWTLAKVGDKPGWWGILLYCTLIQYNSAYGFSGLFSKLLFLLSLVGIVLYILVSLEIAKNFNRSTSFGVLLILIPIVGYPMLAFGPAPYKSTRTRKRVKK
jgi:hypothetical protein